MHLDEGSVRKKAIIAEAVAHMAQALDLLDSVGEVDAAPYLDSALERLRNRDLRICSSTSDKLQ